MENFEFYEEDQERCDEARCVANWKTWRRMVEATPRHLPPTLVPLLRPSLPALPPLAFFPLSLTCVASCICFPYVSFSLPSYVTGRFLCPTSLAGVLIQPLPRSPFFFPLYDLPSSPYPSHVSLFATCIFSPSAGHFLSLLLQLHLGFVVKSIRTIRTGRTSGK